MLKMAHYLRCMITNTAQYKVNQQQLSAQSATRRANHSRRAFAYFALFKVGPAASDTPLAHLVTLSTANIKVTQQVKRIAF